MASENSPIENPTGLEVSKGPPEASRAKKWQGKLIGWGSIVLALLVILATYLRANRYPESDVALLEAPVIGIASRVGGPIKHLEVLNNQAVAAGDILFVIDPEPYEIAVASAEANMAALRGDLANLQRQIEAQKRQVEASEAVLEQAHTHFNETRETYDRLAPLLEKRYASAEQVDTARRAMESAKSGIRAAEAEVAAAQASVIDPSPIEARIVEAETLLAQAQLALQDCTVRAPFDGRVVGLNLAKGAFVKPGISVMMFLSTKEWHVNANFEESVLRHIRPGQRARVQLMTWPEREFEGEVESIGWAVTSIPELPITMVPFIKRELDWVRLSQRFPVRVRLKTEGVPTDFLRAGVTATVTILTDSEQ